MLLEFEDKLKAADDQIQNLLHAIEELKTNHSLEKSFLENKLRIGTETMEDMEEQINKENRFYVNKIKALEEIVSKNKLNQNQTLSPETPITKKTMSDNTTKPLPHKSCTSVHNSSENELNEKIKCLDTIIINSKKDAEVKSAFYLKEIDSLKQQIETLVKSNNCLMETIIPYPPSNDELLQELQCLSSQVESLKKELTKSENTIQLLRQTLYEFEIKYDTLLFKTEEYRDNKTVPCPVNITEKLDCLVITDMPIGTLKILNVETKVLEIKTINDFPKIISLPDTWNPNFVVLQEGADILYLSKSPDDAMGYLYTLINVTKNKFPTPP
ncbi:hypothetical protein J6590_051728 [Homalodisca vitripennis]|nr:hypothetical protein J6590_051728 [Homalodisca vitripennis]